MQEEIKETIYIGVGLLLTTIVITFIVYALELRREYANVRNEVASQQEYSDLVSDYERFDGYNEYKAGYWNTIDCGHCVNGTEVMSAIKKFGVSNKLAVFVNNRGLGGDDLFVYGVENSLDYSLDYLQGEIKSGSKYHPILYYGACTNASMRNSSAYTEYNRDKQVTGIVFIRVY